MPRRLLAGEMARVLRQVSIGIAVGLVAASVFNRASQGEWAGRNGWAGLVVVAGVMLGIGILAALRPAIGALRIQPTEALRSD
jgi:ABC-type antimicrobial peptide transport system permease subunit